MQFKNAMLLEFENNDFKVASLLHIGNCYEKMKDVCLKFDVFIV